MCIDGFAKRFFKSPLFWAIAITVGVIVFTAVAIAVPLSIPLIATISIIAVSVFGLGAIIVSHKQRILYEISLSYNIVRNKLSENWRWYDEIIPVEDGRGSLTQGAIPLKSKNHHVELKDYAFLSMVEESEMRWKTVLSDPLTKEDREIMSPGNHKHISTQDFQPVSVEDLKSGVDWIKDKVESGKNVYVHCKAGRARSGAVVVCYLLDQKKTKFTGEMKEDIDRAIDFIQQKRPQAAIGSEKRKMIEKFYETYCR